MPKTKLEILEETVAYYSEDPSRRSIGYNSECVYYGPDNKRCAYARCWKDGVWHSHLEGRTAASGELPEPDDLVKDQYKGHSRDFWLKIQRLHDQSDCWDLTSLSEKGQNHVDSLRLEFTE